jgi:hypothetical protein
VLDQVASFLRKYLVCDDHQLTILALWVASTRFNQTFSTAAYLDIRSPEPCSGKTTCLNLLDCLCYTRTFLTGLLLSGDALSPFCTSPTQPAPRGRRRPVPPPLLLSTLPRPAPSCKCSGTFVPSSA